MKPTGPLPIIATICDLYLRQKRAFTDTQRELARIARQRIDGDMLEVKRVDVPGKSRTE